MGCFDVFVNFGIEDCVVWGAVRGCCAGFFNLFWWFILLFVSKVIAISVLD
jgi:hypothetical protein